MPMSNEKKFSRFVMEKISVGGQQIQLYIRKHYPHATISVRCS